MKNQGMFCAAAIAAALAGPFAAANPGQQAAPVDPDILAKQRVLAAMNEADAVPSSGGGSVLRGVCPNSATRTPNLPIPQFAGGVPGQVTDQMTTAGDPLLNVRVQLIIPHTWQGDVIARLRHEVSGTEVTLIDRPGVPELSTVGFLADNYGDNASGIPFVLDDTAAQLYGPPDLTVGINNVTGSWRPDDASFTLAAFNGLTADTTWTLTVTDNAGGDLGTLVRWTICSDNPLGQGIPTGVGSATPNPTTDGSLVTFTVQVSPAQAPPSTGLGVVADLSSLGGSSSQMFFDNGTNGDASPGDNLFTFQTVVSGTSGVYSLPFTVSDAQARSSMGTIGLTLLGANDLCEGAIPVSVGSSIISTNIGATNDPGQPTCNGLSTFNAGVWYTTTGNGNVLNVTTCSPNTTLNTRLYIYTGSCGSFTCVNAATGTTPACSPSTAASVQFCSVAGETYYILVTNDTTGTGQFELSVADIGACPTNDLCENAIDVPVGSAIVGNNIGATNDPGQPACNGLSTFNAGVWFTTTGNGNILSVSTCGSNTTLNTRLYIYSGSCGAFTCTTASGGTTPACTPSTAATVAFCSNVGQTYYILVTNDTTGTGVFDLSVTDAGPCPTNDNCPGDVVTAPSSTAGTTVGLTPSGVTSCGANSADAFYRFTPPVSGSYTIDLCGSGFDTRLSVFTDCTTTQIGCNDDACGTQSRLILDLDAGTEYHIRVSAFGATTTGAFVLNISAPPIPTGACCISGACTVLSQADCTAGGGVYQGDDVSCGEVGPNEFTYTSDPFLAIPDNGCTAGYQQDSINVPDSFTIGDVNVRVQVPDHTFLADLQIRLTNGVTTVNLMDDQCGTNAGMDITFDDDGPALVCGEPTVGTFRPTGTTAGLLSAFNGASASGTWTLEICDDLGADVGSLASWSLILRDTAPGPCDGPQFCDADWCQDGEVGVPDIFCFLSDWFANDPDARCFGGTCEVPAIFAFLSAWFAAGQGPCTP